MYVGGEQRCKLSCRQYRQVLRLQVDGNQHQCGEGNWTDIGLGRGSKIASFSSKLLKFELLVDFMRCQYCNISI